METTPERPVADDEIDLLSLVGVLWRKKKMIIACTVSGAVLAVAVSVLSIVLPPETSFLPNLYRPQALMLINDSSSSGGQLSSMLSSSGLGGLASLAGVNVGGGSTYSQLAVYLAGTNHFLDSIIEEFDLVSRYKVTKHPKTETRKELKKMLSASFEDDSGVFSISFEDYDPLFAQRVVDYATNYMEERFKDMGIDQNDIQKENLEVNIANTYEEILRLEQESRVLETSVSMASRARDIPSIMMDVTRIKRELEAQEQVYTQLKIQYELLKVEMASETPVFQILERAEVPDKKSAPSRGMICVIVTFASFFLAVLAAFVLDAIAGIRKDPDALKRLRGEEASRA